ncbi:MAG: phosphatidylglycerophosphatase A [Lactobacillales bacterium]|jgi:phosphatidylglycerophosphatase A|nr:phosphatidylglycerophosphatase A [Lactobacillales bacterium]
MLKMLKEKIAYILASWFYVGYAPKASGTVGSLFALPVVFLSVWFGYKSVLLVSFILFLIGWWATHVVLKTQKDKDPSFVVIDEVMGQTLTFLFVTTYTMNVPFFIFVGFALFRFFDIVKVWPAGFFDKKMENALGVMLDDAVAAVYAGICLYIITLFI